MREPGGPWKQPRRSDHADLRRHQPAGDRARISRGTSPTTGSSSRACTPRDVSPRAAVPGCSSPGFTTAATCGPTVTKRSAPRRGLHAADVNITLGNLVSLVESEARAYIVAPLEPGAGGEDRQDWGVDEGFALLVVGAILGLERRPGARGGAHRPAGARRVPRPRDAARLRRARRHRLRRRAADARRPGRSGSALILYEGGLQTSWRRLREVAVPAALLSTGRRRRQRARSPGCVAHGLLRPLPGSRRSCSARSSRRPTPPRCSRRFASRTSRAAWRARSRPSRAATTRWRSRSRSA